MTVGTRVVELPVKVVDLKTAKCRNSMEQALNVVVTQRKGNYE